MTSSNRSIGKGTNHSSIEVCTCGYSTYSAKWMRKHMLKEHNDNGVFKLS